MNTNEKTFTPGPWVWTSKHETEDGRPTWSLVSYGDGGYGVLSCDGVANSPHGLPEYPKNAHLIATAPELYGALELLVNNPQDADAIGIAKRALSIAIGE